MSIALVILAAGKGTRMESDVPKVLHTIGGAPLLHHAMLSTSGLEPAKTVVVTGHGADLVEASAKSFDPDVITVRQEDQLGTGHAVAQAKDALSGFDGDVIVLYGDTPFITTETLEQMIAARKTFDVVVLGFEAADPGKYGRLIMDGASLHRIVEYKDATEEERARSEEHTSELQSLTNLVCRLLLEKKKKKHTPPPPTTPPPPPPPTTHIVSLLKH